MTLAEAAAELERAGLHVDLAPPPTQMLGAAGDEYDPPDHLVSQGVTRCWHFGVTIREIKGSWFLRVGSPIPSEEHASLRAAVTRALQLWQQHRSSPSKPVPT